MIKSLKTRVAVWYISLSTAILIGFGLAVYFDLSRRLHRERESLIRGDVARVRQIALSHGRRGQERFLNELDERLAMKPEDEFVQVFTRDGANLYSSPNLKGRRLPFKPELGAGAYPALQGATAFDDQQPLLLTVAPVEIRDGTVLVTVAASLATVKATERRLLFALLLAAPIAVLAALLGGALLARRAIEPVDQIAAAASRITARNLNERIHLPRADRELERLAEAFNQMITRLEQAFTQVRQFTADASHELRTPLAILKGETQLALDDNLSPDEYKQALKSRMEELERMAKIVDDLLALARADSQEAALDLQVVDLSDVVIETCEQMRRYAEAKRLSLRLERVDPIEVKGDGLRLRQMFRNLLDNSIKYTPDGGEVRVALESNSQSRCKLTVTDTGIGIPAEDLPRVFDRFYRVDKARSRELGGSGLGLSIVKWVVEAHGGKIALESETGKGTRAIVLFHVAEARGAGRNQNDDSLLEQ